MSSRITPLPALEFLSSGRSHWDRTSSQQHPSTTCRDRRLHIKIRLRENPKDEWQVSWLASVVLGTEEDVRVVRKPHPPSNWPADEDGSADHIFFGDESLAG